MRPHIAPHLSDEQTPQELFDAKGEATAHKLEKSSSDFAMGSCGDRSEHVTKAQAAVLAKEVRKAKLSPEDLQVVLNAVSVLNAAWDFKGASGLLQECAWRSRYRTSV